MLRSYSSHQMIHPLYAVSASLFERLGSRGAQIAQPLVERVGALCAEAAEAEGKRSEGDEAEPYEGAAAAAMGDAIRHLGPQQVLGILPLNIAEVRERSASLWSHDMYLNLLHSSYNVTLFLSLICGMAVPFARASATLRPSF